MRKLTHEELLQRQQETSGFRVPVVGVLNNLRSLYNVGSIFRTADGAGLEKLFLCGVTGIPPDTKITKTALGAEKSVPWEYSRHAADCVRKLKDQGYQIIMLEQTVRSIPIQEFVPKGPCALIVGNEISGVQDDLVSLCDKEVEIPMAGLKISLNVSVAFGIAAYHLKHQFQTGVKS